MIKSSFKTQAIVLKRLNFGEADKFITFYSRDYGRLTTLAKGVRRIKSRRASHLEIFNQVDIFVVTGKAFYILREAQAINSFSFLKTKLPRVIHAYKIVEVVDKFCPENQKNKTLFNLLLEGLENLNNPRVNEFKPLVEDFINRLLCQLGFLTAEKKLSGFTLEKYIEQILERKLKVNNLLTKIS